MVDPIEEIKSRLSIEELVSSYVQLKKAGRSLKGLCPFHSEKTPSFVVSSEKQICHCFGCNKGGDIFTFIQEVEGITFPEALNLLADRVGIKIEKNKSKSSTVSKKDKDEFYRAHDLAAEFFEKQLFTTKNGEKVLEYLYKRGLKDETIKEFRLGFAPDSYDALYPFLLKKGINKNVLIKSGLVSAKNLSSDSIYDKYRQRLIFPIFNNFGKICGFGGRALKKDQMPKYLNSPENIIYNKSKLLYGLYHAKKAIKEVDKILLVEGYFDVILPYQAGICYVAASSGTALTSDQVRLIKRFTKNAISCFDSDNAGFEASKRAYSLLKEQGFSVKAVSGLEGKDPADFVLHDFDNFKSSVDSNQDFMDFYIDELIKRNDISAFSDRMKIIQELLPFYKKFSSVEKDYYLRGLAVKLGVDERSLYDELENFSLPSSHPARKKEAPLNKVKFSLLERVVALFLEYPVLFKDFSVSFSESDFSDDIKRVYKALSDQYNSTRGKLKAWKFDMDVLSDLRGKIDVLYLFAEESYGRFSDEMLRDEISALINRFQKDKHDKSLRDLHQKISAAEEENDKEKLIELLSAQQKLLSKS